jgi:two-component system, NarL family, nitrate/nitrite response regulator NarL
MLIVDDHPVVRHGMAALLAQEQWIERVIEAGTAQEARRLATLERPGLAVLDLTLPDGDGILLIRDILSAVPDCSIVIVTMTNDPGLVRTATDAGARGYVLKDASPLMLVAAVRTVAEGGRILGPGLDPPVTPNQPLPAPFDALTPRELQLVKLLGQGHSYRQIARSLSLSEKTVRNQISIITAKLGVADRVQAALLAQRAGLTG